MIRKSVLVAVAVSAILTLLALPSGPAQARYASIVIDAESGQVLHAVNADTRNYPASLTKMMTLYMVFDALEKGRLTLDQELPVSKRAYGMPPSKLGLKVGETIRVRDAILALVTKSANDVAVVVAEALAGKETKFAQAMTKRARALGMRRTSFRNASGLPNRGQKSTARDMARLAQALLTDFPQYYHYFSTSTFSYNGRTYRSHNKLLKSYRGTDGIKTGYIRASGFNLVTSVERRNRRIIAVVFGGKTARSRDRHMVKLLNRGFKKLASQGVRSIPRVPGRNPFQAPLATLEIAAASGDKTAATASKPVETAAAPPSRDHLPRPARPVKPVPKSSLVATVDSSQSAVEVESLTNDWTVQVGAFSRFSTAHKSAKSALAQAPKALRGAKVAIRRVDSTTRGTFYRSQLTGLYEKQAREACQTLVAAEISCVVLQPEAVGSR